MSSKLPDITVTALFIAVAAAARKESRRYWAVNGKRFPKQEPSFWPATPEGTDDTLRERRHRRRQKGVWT
ncbi:hypothetical protein GCM10010869_28210 [Mesorhizobium tianshanense]|uniref:Uncharacterized protein n=1 Tax=Mesorhizobium tianshanense TaxID=39844 RepID=A0A562MMV3_9HYPH|nr:hypothetical protein [Mesorhizobium tianshanense]TWI21216.1 hypothetical protein IQ26_06893 [Mesorhizobium tianshanense]GLS37228.1 hypothetical protein GCM10010869_28210 [Mesorhizobium tianshanense]